MSDGVDPSEGFSAEEIVDEGKRRHAVLHLGEPLRDEKSNPERIAADIERIAVSLDPNEGLFPRRALTNRLVASNIIGGAGSDTFQTE
jgi:hypothetical protein